MREWIKAKHKGLSDSCKIAQEIWQRCCEVPKLYPLHIRAEMLDSQAGYCTFPVWKCSGSVLFFIIVKLQFAATFHMTTRVFINFSQKRFFRSKIEILVRVSEYLQIWEDQTK